MNLDAKNYDDLVGNLKASLITVAASGVMKTLVAQFSFLALNPLFPICLKLVTMVLTIALRDTELGAYYLYVDLLTDRQAKEFKDAVGHYKLAKEVGTPEDREEAAKRLISTARDLIRFGS